MTAAEYRVVHFIPNPVSGARVAVAALLRAEGGIRVLSPEHHPGAECLGSSRAVNLLRAVRPQLERMEDFGILPESLGPLFQLGHVQQVPVTQDMEAELRRLLFPIVTRPKVQRGPQRARQGVNWLQRNGVSLDWIRRGFRPADVGLESKAKIATHFVKGNAGLLLMEPIVAAARSRSEVLSAIELATTRLRGADHVLNSAGFKNERGFVAYLLPGSSEDAADVARRALFNFEGAGVVECSNPQEAAAFTGRIRHIAEPLALN